MISSKRPEKIIVKLYALLLVCFITVISADDRLRIYIAADDHTDFMWSADEKTYQKAFLDMLDYYIDMADSTIKCEPPQYQSRFTCDGSYWMWTYEKNRSSIQFQRLIKRIKSGHITVPLTPITLCYGGMPAEAVIRSMYYAGRIERRYDIRFPMAAPMENQTMPAGVGSIWAGAGAEYCWMGICGCASRVDFHKSRMHEIYWWSGLDGSRLLMKWNSLNDSGSLEGYANESLGGYAEARRPLEAMYYVENDSGFKARYPYKVIGIFGKGWDDLKTESVEFIDIAKNSTNEKRQVFVSNEVDFFRDFGKTYDSDLPSFFAAFGNEWDLYSASMAGLTARMKNATEKLRSAEALSVLVSLQDTGFMKGREKARELAFMNMGLFWNHDWTADGPVSKAEYEIWARRTTDGVETYVNTLCKDARLKLGKMIAKSSSHVRVYAFNPLGWPRTDIADIHYENKNTVHIIDLSSGQETPSQIVHIDGKRYLRWLALTIPSIGYKVYEIRPGKGEQLPLAAEFKGDILENDYYRLTITNRGAISSLIDKKFDNSEIVQTINGKVLNDLGTGSGKIEIENAGPVSVTIMATSASPLRHTSRITVFRHSDRIDIENRIIQNFSAVGDNPPSWAFSFALHNPEVWHEEVGAVLKAKLLSDGGHYSPTHARYDWFTLNHFVNISGENKSITLSNQDCSFFKFGESTVQILDTSTPQISVLIGGQIDGPTLGIPAQGGDSLFIQRFALRTGRKFDQAEDMCFSMEHQNSLVTGIVVGSKAVYPENIFSLLTISDPKVLLWALKPAEDGISVAGIVTRFWNMGAGPSDCDIHFIDSMVTDGKEITHIETPIREAIITQNSLKIKLSPYQIKSYRVKPMMPKKTGN
jgi:alpha-mannosidase